ncbi:hypothetical protein L218DRAFT_1072899 [Marasmius fiardii PR-910]|nr:hypothetical protein L218DRAFT_1072899 [Marasmius fiardii PR-910]
MSASTSSTLIIACPQPVATINSADGSFGHTFSTSVSKSRHDRRISSSDIDLELGFSHEYSPDVAPPPYVEPPEYTRSPEIVTLAKYLFRFGFLFPPFWIMGALIILTPLRAPDADISDPASPHAWLPEKTEAERAVILSHLRRAELKWAWRCFYALCIIILLAVAAGIAIWTVLRT